MEDSILKTTKKHIGLGEEYDVFDLDIITHINTAFATLNQLGIGPAGGFQIEDESSVWSDFYGDEPRYNPIQTYVYLRVSLLFDPPTMGYLVDAKQKQIQELEWRLGVMRDELEEEVV